MKPLNYDNSPCSPTSSNCVIWQGPDLHCIKLCTGDTVSDVIASLATELCTVMDQLSITNYDLSCFDLVGCKPETFQELLQFLIEQICLAQGISPTTVDGKTNDELITVAPCFIVNGITVMTLTDYVIAIGLRVCNIIDQISVINNTLKELDIRVTILENTPPPTFTLPTVASDCILQNSPQIGGLGSPAVPMDQLLSILINDNDYGYCALLDATGLPAYLIDAVLSQCILNTDIQLSSTTGATYSASANWNSNWQTTENNLAASLSNVWVVLCDIYNYLDNPIGLTITETNCQTGIANNANVYGYIDVTSGPYYGPNYESDGVTPTTTLLNKQILCSALNTWFTNYQAANLSYTGGLYIFEYGQPEDYLNLPNKIKSGDAFSWLNPSTALYTGAVVPPGYGIGWVCPNAMLFIAFVNEASYRYHNTNVLPPTLVGQPTALWTTDFNTFVTDYTSFWTSFNAVIYPAYDATATEQNFLLQAYAATNNVDISYAGLSGALGPNYNPALTSFGGTNVGPGSNPYITASQGLWSYGWGSILNKAVDTVTGLLTFTEAEFENDLNNLLLEDESCNSESLIESWDPISQSLVLRQITSCCLDLSVTSEGCLSIDCAPGSLSVVEAGTNVNITSNIVGTTTTYTVNSDPNLETFVANLTINSYFRPDSGSIQAVTPASVNGITDGQTISEYTLVSSNSQAVRAAITSWVPNLSLPTFTFGSFNNATGIFTINDPGTYLIKATAHLKPDNGTTVFWSGPATFSATPTVGELESAFLAIGSFYIGITPDNTSDVYVADSQTLTPGIDKCVELSTSKVIITDTTIDLKVKVLNTTNRSYSGTGYTFADSISFSIIKLRNNLTITQL